MNIGLAVTLAIFAFFGGFMLLTSGWERPPMEVQQLGFRGLGMEEVINPRTQRTERVAAEVPEPPWPLEPAEGPAASEIYENVPVLGDLPATRFDRLMAAVTEWVSPEEGCAYCHDEANLAADNVYTKIVSRRMFQMTRHINAEWGAHVGDTGVTCLTCHRGQPVPAQVWFEGADPDDPQGLAGNRAGQNAPADAVGLASLPEDPFTGFLSSKGDQEGIRVISNTALPADNRKSIKQTEWTYGLMMHFSESLGVNCTYCHNSRSFFAWDQSRPERVSAWHGIRLVSDLNQNYLEPLQPQYPHARLGPRGDAPKANCATCHQGAFKPLFGAKMLDDYPSLAGTAGE